MGRQGTKTEAQLVCGHCGWRLPQEASARCQATGSQQHPRRWLQLRPRRPDPSPDRTTKAPPRAGIATARPSRTVSLVPVPGPSALLLLDSNPVTRAPPLARRPRDLSRRGTATSTPTPLPRSPGPRPARPPRDIRPRRSPALSPGPRTQPRPHPTRLAPHLRPTDSNSGKRAPGLAWGRRTALQRGSSRSEEVAAVAQRRNRATDCLARTPPLRPSPPPAFANGQARPRPTTAAGQGQASGGAPCRPGGRRTPGSSQGSPIPGLGTQPPGSPAPPGDC